MAASPSVAGTLATTLASLSADFDTDELAYLALTGTVEPSVRDRLAWRLQQELGRAYVVARAWRRADLAVLTGESAVLQVRSRAVPASELLETTSRTEHLAELAADGLRMSAMAPESSALLLALVTYVRDRGDSVDTARRARKLWESELARVGWASARFTLGGGSRWGRAVELDAYLVGPLPPGEA